LISTNGSNGLLLILCLIPLIYDGLIEQQLGCIVWDLLISSQLIPDKLIKGIYIRLGLIDKCDQRFFV